MRVNANAVLRSWMLLAAFGGSYAPALYHHIFDAIIMVKLCNSFHSRFNYLIYPLLYIPNASHVAVEVLGHDLTLVPRERG